MKQPRIAHPLLLVGLCLPACGDEPLGERAPTESPAPSPTTEPGYSIKLLVGGAEVRVGPTATPPEVEGEQKAQAIITLPEGEAQTGALSSTVLLMGAAAECGIYDTEYTQKRKHPSAASAAVFPWLEQNSWFVFRAKGSEPDFQSCDDVLYHTEVLLCMADRLSEVGDAVAPVVWKGTQWGPDWFRDIYPGLQQPWLIHPQAQRDRFIAIQLAQNVLAHVARLDATVPNAGFPERSCADGYARAHADPAWGVANSQLLFGVAGSARPPYFLPYESYLAPAPGGGMQTVVGPVQVTQANIPRMAQARLEFEAQVLRQAGHLVKDVVDNAVSANISGAETLRAQAADRQLGLEYFWGARTQESFPFNTIAHGLKMVAGRIEYQLPPTSVPTVTTDAPVPLLDPRCSGYYALHLVAGDPVTGQPSALGPEIVQRWQETPVRNRGQALAAELFDGSSLVIPSEGFTSGAVGVDTLRTALADQLELNGALAIGIDPADPADADRWALHQSEQGSGPSMRKLVTQLADEDLVFGAQRSEAAYRVVTGTTAGAALGSVAGVNLSPGATGSAFASLGGGVVAGGLTRDDAAVDYFARAAGAFAASQCPEYLRADRPPGDSVNNKVAAFQSSFMLGDVLRERLTTIRDLTVDPALKRAHKVANIGSAELKTWTGPGRVYTRAHFLGKRQQFVIAGLTPKDLGVATPEQMKSALVAVYGEPWVADCAAGLRQSCPENFEQDFVQTPSLAAVDGEFSEAQDFNGSDGHVLNLHFATDSGAPEFRPQVVTLGEHARKYIFLVAKADPAQPGRGRVLAAFARRRLDPGGGLADPVGPWLTDVISDYQRELVNDLLGIKPSIGGDRNRFGDLHLAYSPKSCIPGVPRDFFVPLENELTSDNDQYEDSWKHYTNLAALAAQRADELGNELIAQGLARAEREEASREVVGEICGDFAALDKLKIEDNEISAPSDDSALSHCFNEPTFDAVFLTNDPFAGMSDAEATAGIRALLDCDGPDSSNELCERDPSTGAFKTETITHAGLNKAVWEDPRGGGTPREDACEFALSVATSAGVDPNTTALAHSDFAQSDRLAATLAVTNFRMDREGHWSVTVGSERLMGTRAVGGANDPWPACATDTDLPEGPCNDPIDQELNRLIEPASAFNLVSPAWRIQMAQRIQSELWTMAALSGSVPEGLFTVPIPVVNFGVRNEPAPAPTVFGTGRYLHVGNDEHRMQLVAANSTNARFGEVSETDSAILGPLLPIEFEFASNMSAYGPREWVRTFYDQAAQAGGFNPAFLSAMASNSARIFPDIGGAPAVVAGVVEAARNGSNKYPNFRYPREVQEVCFNPKGRVLMLDEHKSAGTPLVLSDVFEYRDEDFPESVNDQYPFLPPNGDARGWASRNSWYAGEGWSPGEACYHPVEGGAPMINPAQGCERNDGALPGQHRYTHQVLLPRVCKPGDRVQLYIDSRPFETSFASALSIQRSLGLACLMDQGATSLGTAEPLPPIRSASDLVYAERWVENRARDVRRAASSLLLRGIPKRAVKDTQTGGVGSGSIAGEHGQHVLAIEAALAGVASGLIGIASDLDQMGFALGTARLELTSANLRLESTLNSLAMQRLSIMIQMVDQVARGAQGVVGMVFGLGDRAPAGKFSEGVINAGAGAISLGFSVQQFDLTADAEDIAKDQKANEVASALHNLSASLGTSMSTIQTHFEGVRSSTASALSSVSALRQSENRAKYQAAKAVGADYVETEDGTAVFFPVNTVTRRQNLVTKARYEAAKRDAKYLAYMARLAIEQRIGQRLSDIENGVGPMDPPSAWADDICNLEGIDYDKFSSFTVPKLDAPVESRETQDAAVVKEWLNGYIGDYVTKLSNFVEYYNIEYPFREADDVVVLSVRDDLLGAGGRCQREARNLLFHSGSLSTTGGNESPAVNGWETRACLGTVKCLHAEPGDLLLDLAGVPVPPPDVSLVGGVTWLHDVSVADMTLPDGWDGLSSNDDAVPGSAPSGSVGQSVSLSAGVRYTLSWWDHARGPHGEADVGALPGYVPPPYMVSIYDAAGVPTQAVFSAVPHIATLAEPWSGRRELTFTPSTSGAHVVAFAAGVGATTGSVAVANVQLEVTPADNLASSYQHTSASRRVFSGDCASGRPEGFRDAFTYGCDGTDCFYDIKVPFVIDTEAILAGDSRLSDKLARGNFNYRHISTAVNVVGTGVIDCESATTPDCYGTGLVDYSLDHVGHDAKIVNYHGDPRRFNFATGFINFGKALAAERYLTAPLGSADQALLAQPQFTKPELSGRPLSGSYHLRVYDKPSLAWDRVEDVQIVLSYRYWSRISRAN